MLTSCHSDIDLNNIDTTAELEMGVVVPIGSMHATVGDFVGNGQVPNLYVDTLDNQGVITWKDTFEIARDYHKLNLSNHISQTTLNLKVYEKVAWMIGMDGKITGTGEPITLDFPVTIHLDGINKPSSLQDERLDSAMIDSATFKSIIQRQNLPLQWEWIDQVTLDLGDQVRRDKGNTMVVYKKGQQGGYGTEIPTTVDDFTVILMKDRYLTPDRWSDYKTNVVDTCAFTVHFTFTIPQGEKVEIDQDAAFKYNLAVQFVDYKAVWGMFSPSGDMRGDSIIDFGKEWGDLAFLQRACLPFAKPSVDVNIFTQIAGALYLEYGAQLFTIDSNGKYTYALFKGKDVYEHHFDQNEYLLLNSPIGAVSDNMHILFDNDAQRGQIDRLFENMPQKIGYKFSVNFNQQKTPQIRMTNDQSIKAQAIATLPLIFKNGLFLNYSDTVDVDLQQADIDSLINEVEYIDTLKATDIKLILKTENTIPLDVKATMRCLDAAGNVIMDPDDPTKPFLPYQRDEVMKDTLLIPAPTFYEAFSGEWYCNQPGTNTIIISVNKRRAQMLPMIKKIVYYAQIDESSLQNTYQKGMKNVKIYEDSGLRIFIGLTTHLDAIFNLNNFNKK